MLVENDDDESSSTNSRCYEEKQEFVDRKGGRNSFLSRAPTLEKKTKLLIV